VVLQVEDGAAVIEAPNIDDLSTQLRLKYPDEAYERFLRCERDRKLKDARRKRWMA